MKNSLAMSLFVRGPSAWNMEEYANNIEAGLLSFLPGEKLASDIHAMPSGLTYDPLTATLANAALAFERNTEAQGALYRDAMSRAATRIATHLLSGGAGLFGATVPTAPPGHSLALELAVRGPCPDVIDQMLLLPGCPSLKTLAAAPATIRLAEPRPLLVHLAACGNDVAVELLLAAGADPHVATADGQTGPHLTSSPSILKIFANHGFDPNTADVNGASAHMAMGARRDIPTRQIDELRQAWKKSFGPSLVHARYATLSQGLAGKTKTLFQKELSSLRWRPSDTEEGKTLVQALATSMLQVPSRLHRRGTASLVLDGADLTHVGPMGVSDGLLRAVAALAIPDGDLADPHGYRLLECAEADGSLLEVFETALRTFEKMRPARETEEAGLADRFRLRLLCALVTRRDRAPVLAELTELLNAPCLKPLWKALPSMDAKGQERALEALETLASNRLFPQSPSLVQQAALHPAEAAPFFNFALVVASDRVGSFYVRPTLGPNGMPTHIKKDLPGETKPRSGAQILDLLWDAGVRPSNDRQGQAAMAVFSKAWPEAAPTLVNAMLDSAVAKVPQAGPRLRM